MATAAPAPCLVLIHPATADPPLPRPFQDFVPSERLFSLQRATGRLLDVLTEQTLGNDWSASGLVRSDHSLVGQLFQVLDRDHLQGAAITGFEAYGRCHAVFIGLKPAACADTPVIACFEPRKTEYEDRRREVIALGFAVGEKGLAHDAADRMPAQIRRVGAAATVTKPTGDRIATAEFQGPPEHVERSIAGGHGS